MARMDGRAVAIAIPVFFLLMAIELAVDVRRRRSGGPALYRFADSIASLSSGVGQQLLQALAFGAVGVSGYAFVSARLAFVRWPDGPLGWALAFVLVDFCYWAYHLTSHRVNFFWATHEVHHQSEDYNLSTALRQSWFTGLTSWMFYSPAALLGVPQRVFVLCITLNILYQFWIHTRTVDRLGPLEWIFNTPSHHRVHHGIDPEYVDKNYAGVFIVWDRLFGTFVEERREPAYGLVKPLGSFNPFWSNVAGFARLATLSRRTRRWRDKLRIWVAPPEWYPDDLGGPVVVPEVDHATRVRFDVPRRPVLELYIVAHFLLVSAVVFSVLWWSKALALPAKAALVGFAMLGLATWAGLLERRTWALPLEFVRLASGLGVAAVVAGGTGWLGVALGASAALGTSSGLVVFVATRLQEGDRAPVPAAGP
jgi:alkylglycerol monooxygenase